MDLSEPAPQTQRTAGMHSAGIAVVALVATTLALYSDTVASLWSVWTRAGSAYHHGLPLVVISAVLLYRRWVEVKPVMQVRPSVSALLLVLLISLGWLLGSLVDVLIVQQVSLVLLLGLVFAAVVGYRTGWLFAFPVTLLVFAVPVWDPLVPHLQALTARVTIVLLNLTGIPAVLQGTQIFIPAGVFDVKPACSGVSQLIVGTMAAALFAYVNRLDRRAAIWLVAAAVGISLLTNTLRVYTTVVIGQVSGMQHYLVTEHWAPAWILFGVGMFVFFFFATRWVERTQAAPAPQPAASGLAAAEDAPRVMRNACLALLALASGPALVQAYQAEHREVGRLVLDLPAQIGSWHIAAEEPFGYRPVFHRPDLEHEALYRDAEGRQVYLYVAKYVRQEQGKEAVYAANLLYDGETWRPMFTSSPGRGSAGSAQEVQLESRNGAEKLVWQWYYVHGFAVGSGFVAKLLNAWGVLNRDPAITAVVVATDVKGSESSAGAEVLRRFVEDAGPGLEHAIDNARAR